MDENEQRGLYIKEILEEAKQRRLHIKEILDEIPQKNINSNIRDKNLLKLEKKIKKYELKNIKNGVKRSSRRYINKNRDDKA